MRFMRYAIPRLTVICEMLRGNSIIHERGTTSATGHVVMSGDFEFRVIHPKHSPEDMAQVRTLLARNDLQLDSRIELFVVGRDHGCIIACAGLDENTIKCVAISHQFRGDSLSLQLGTEVVRLAAEKGHFHLFLYSPPHNIKIFRGWGFYPLVQLPNVIVLMENSPVAIKKYCDTLRLKRQLGKTIGSIVMNANPFTLAKRNVLRLNLTVE